MATKKRLAKIAGLGTLVVLSLSVLLYQLSRGRRSPEMPGLTQPSAVAAVPALITVEVELGRRQMLTVSRRGHKAWVEYFQPRPGQRFERTVVLTPDTARSPSPQP